MDNSLSDSGQFLFCAKAELSLHISMLLGENGNVFFCITLTFERRDHRAGSLRNNNHPRSCDRVDVMLAMEKDFSQ